VATINGTASNDTLSGTSGDDTINGLGGNDSFLAGGNSGADLIDGGTGTDSIEFRARATSGIVVDFVAGTITGGGSGTISFTGVERVVAGHFNDSLRGNAAAQTLTGEGGADTLWGAGGVDTLWGGAGTDTFIFRETGTANADRINDWASGSDTLLLDGSVMSALGANGDFAAGDARFWSSASGVAHDADDRIIFNTTTRQVFYDADGNGSGAAQLIATLSNATLVATDIAVEGGSSGGGQTINGTAGNDSLVGTEGDDTIFGHGSNDTLDGGQGADTLDGGAGDDSLIGGDLEDGADLLVGSDGNDTLDGWSHFFGEQGPAPETLDGGLGNDVYWVDNAGDVLVDAGGFDTVHAADMSWTLGAGFERLHIHNGPAESARTGTGNELANLMSLAYTGRLEGLGGNDTLVASNWDVALVGGDGDDVLEASTGLDTLIGGAGNDTMRGGDSSDLFVFDASFGNDSVDGSTGRVDVLLFSDAGSAVTVDFATGTASGSAGSVSFVNIEKAVGSAFHDVLRAGDTGSQLAGGAGDDTLAGGAGNDILEGGSGVDHFAFDQAPGAANADTIADFVSGTDQIRLDAAVMTGLGATGRFSAGDARFHAGAAAHDADDRVIWDGTSLWYDADGTGAQAMQRIVSLGSVSFVATDIAVDNGSPGGTILGTEGDDTLDGTGGNDTISAFGGDDFVTAREGNDSLDGGSGHDRLWADSGDDFLTGGAGNDLLVGQGGNDTQLGGEGDDTFYGGIAPQGQFGHDSLDGGSGIDLLDYTRTSIWSGVTIDLGAGALTGGDQGGTGSATVAGIENVVASGLADRIVGSAAANMLDGYDGRDTLEGGAGDDTLFGSFSDDWLIGGDGNDWLDGGHESDTLTGGAGADDFAFTTDGVDAITDFASALDELRFEGTTFTRIGASDFGAGDARFHAAAGATSGQDADDRVIYNTTTGEVFYDADGSGSQASRLVARLQPGAALVASDIGVDNGIPDQQVNGGPGDDSLTGGEGFDTINGLGGNDTLNGLGGDDVLDGGPGNDSLEGGEGADRFAAGDGNDTLHGIAYPRHFGEGELEVDTMDGGLGDDEYWIENPNDILSDAGGVDTVHVDNMDWTLGAAFENLVIHNDWFENFQTGIGNELDNHMLVSYAGSRLEGRGGNDTLVGGVKDQGGNLLLGGEGNDSINGRGFSDTIDGGSGNDTLSGGWFDEFVFTVAPGTANADQIVGFVSADDEVVLDGAVHLSSGPSGGFAENDARFAANSTGTAQDASDRVIYNTANGQLWYDADGSGAGSRQLIATLQGAPTLAADDIRVINGSASGQVINGTSGNDTLAGSPGDDTINGLGGNDLFVASANGGNDVIDGGTGTDSIEFRDRATSAVLVDFASGSIQGGGSGTISFTAVERVVASNFNDTLTGTAGTQTLTGQGGADTLAGAGGVDTLWGGGGADTFIFREMGTTNADRISDWASASDKVALDNAVMNALGTDGNFSSGDARFAAGAGFTSGRDATDRVIFNTSTGSLYYDADGSGAGGAQLIATVQSGAGMAATDITVI
jgi:Ca2+-binding RTX toxin-like protein